MLKYREKGVIVFITIVFTIWFLGKITSPLHMIPHPWLTEISAVLTSGDKVIFQSRVVGKEADNSLLWIKNGVQRKFTISDFHSGYRYIKIKSSEDENGIWVESDREVVATLDLSAGVFKSELDRNKPYWAVFGQGKIIAEGKTRSLFDYLIPW